MKITYRINSDKAKVTQVWNATLDNSPEERKEIAEQIFKALIKNGEIRFDHFSVTFIHIIRSNCEYHEGIGDTFCDEETVEFKFDIAPIDYMDLVILMAIKEVNEMPSLLYLEKALTELDYKGEKLAQLTEVIKPFRENWERKFFKKKQ